MRLFLAIDLPSEMKEQLDNQLYDLKKEYPQFTWVSPENYHITLHFFGEVADVEKIKKGVENAIYDVPSFHMYSSEADLFIHKTIVLYITFARSRALEELVNKIRERFQVDEKQKFVPHLTVARYKIPSKQQYFLIKKKMQNLEVDLEFPVNKIYLFDSILGGKKPTYKNIGEFFLLEKE